MQLIATLTLALAATSYARVAPLRARQDNEAVYPPCGGFVTDPQTCDEGFQCIQDPRRPGDITDLPGICVPQQWTRCGGISNLECMPGSGPTQCNDWPLDDCNPDEGSSDCIGICLYPL